LTDPNFLSVEEERCAVIKERGKATFAPAFVLHPATPDKWRIFEIKTIETLTRPRFL
jgi:hypothetical protein